MTEITVKDKVFAKPLIQVKAFQFDEEVTRVFDDMISRSVPGYELLVRLIGLYADIFVQEKSRVYDLGCSTGVVSRVVAQQILDRQCEVIAVDNSPSMIERCKQLHSKLNIEWVCGDIQQIAINNASLVILNLTLQFIPPEQRDSLLKVIHDGMLPGGVLVLSEKLLDDDEHTRTKMTELYQAFKKNQGYSDLEISQKRTALERVLIPDKRSEHLSRLQRCGFDEVIETFHCFNFVSFLAVKNDG